LAAPACTWLQNQYDALVYHEVIPAIRADCRSSDIEIVSAGASIGAFNALATLCRHPDAVRVAIGMSGTYDLSPWLRAHFDDDIYFASPWHYLPKLGEGSQVDLLHRRFALLAYGGGRWEAPDENWHMAELLGAKGIPNRVDAWGPEWDHDWPTWHRMLPHYLDWLA
jgi:esterase/lipase superfamily enzyme